MVGSGKYPDLANLLGNSLEMMAIGFYKGFGKNTAYWVPQCTSNPSLESGPAPGRSAFAASPWLWFFEDGNYYDRIPQRLNWLEYRGGGVVCRRAI